MGKYEEKEKTRKLRVKAVWKALFIALATLIGAIVMNLLDWTDYFGTRYTNNAAYTIGLVIILLVSEVGTVIHSAIRKRKEKSLLLEEKVAEQSEVG